MEEPLSHEEAAAPGARGWIALLAGVFCVLGFVGGCAVISATEAPKSPTRVLFVGNSMTYYNGGIDTLLNAFAPSIDATSVVHSRNWLQDHWLYGRARPVIRDGNYSVVVLQDHSQAPILQPTEFRKYMKAFDAEVRARGGRSVILETWQTPEGESRGITTVKLDAACQSAGADLGIAVAPAGLAFERVREQRPDLALTLPDGHPTPSGTYLATCVVYGTILDRSPLEIPDNGFLIDSPFWIGPETRAFLRQVAADTLGY